MNVSEAIKARKRQAIVNAVPLSSRLGFSFLKKRIIISRTTKTVPEIKAIVISVVLKKQANI